VTAAAACNPSHFWLTADSHTSFPFRIETPSEKRVFKHFCSEHVASASFRKKFPSEAVFSKKHSAPTT